MSIVQLSRKNVLSLFAGITVIVLIGIITSTISFFIHAHIARTIPVYNFKSAFTQQPYLTFSWLLRAVSFLSPILGGMVVGRMIKKNGWIYGGMLGVVLLLISIALVSLTFILPSSVSSHPALSTQQTYGLAQRNIINQLLHSPLTIILTAFGGYLGEFLYRRNQKKK